MKKAFVAAPGVRSVNGSDVPANRVIMLTDVEALYDLAQGRILPAPTKPKRARRNERH